MSLSEFSLFLPGSANGSSNNKTLADSKNQVKIDIKKIQSDFKRLIDTIISLINDKKRLESELIQLKTNSQKQKNISSTSKNSKELLKYIGLLDNYLIEVNKTLKDHPNQKAEILSEIQERINKNFGTTPKTANNSSTFGVTPMQTVINNSSIFGATPRNANNFGIPKKANNSSIFGATPRNVNNFGSPKKANNSSIFGMQTAANNSNSSVFKNNKSNIKYAKTLEELMGVNFEPNNNGNTIQENLFLNKKQKNEFINNSGRVNGNSNKGANNASSFLGSFGNGISSRSENNASSVLGNFGNGISNRAKNNESSVLGSFGNGISSRSENNASSVLGNFGNGNGNGNRNGNRNGNGNSNRGVNNTRSLTNFLNMNTSNSERVVEENNNEEEEEEEQQQQPNNSKKSVFSTIAETIGLTSPTTPQNNVNGIQTKMKKAQCNGEDCDIFNKDAKTLEINLSKLGKNINNSKNRFNNARRKIMKLMGEQVTVSMKNNRSQIANIPKEGDIGEYYIT